MCHAPLTRVKNHSFFTFIIIIISRLIAVALFPDLCTSRRRLLYIAWVKSNLSVSVSYWLPRAFLIELDAVVGQTHAMCYRQDHIYSAAYGPLQSACSNNLLLTG